MNSFCGACKLKYTISFNLQHPNLKIFSQLQVIISLVREVVNPQEHTEPPLIQLPPSSLVVVRIVFLHCLVEFLHGIVCNVCFACYSIYYYFVEVSLIIRSYREFVEILL